ncbi:hypothetical protein ACVWZM_004405 [Bradyrhizobium sp. USDA 4501]
MLLNLLPLGFVQFELDLGKPLIAICNRHLVRRLVFGVNRSFEPFDDEGWIDPAQDFQGRRVEFAGHAASELHADAIVSDENARCAFGRELFHEARDFRLLLLGRGLRSFDPTAFVDQVCDLGAQPLHGLKMCLSLVRLGLDRLSLTEDRIRERSNRRAARTDLNDAVVTSIATLLLNSRPNCVSRSTMRDSMGTLEKNAFV